MDEFDSIDIDLREFLDELVKQSLACINTIQWAQIAINHKNTTDADKLFAFQVEHEAYEELKEIAECYCSTLEFH